MVTRDLYFFNPTCEIAIANGSETFMAAQILREFEDDLSFLPMIIASPDDYILSSVRPSAAFIESLKRIGFPVSYWASKEEIQTNPALQFVRINPWGWSPAVHFQLKEIKKQVCGSFRESKVFNWKAEQKMLFERKTSAQVLERFITEFGSDNYCSLGAFPLLIQSENEIADYLKKCPNAVLKSPVSSSGRGVQMIRNGKLSRTNSQWANGILEQLGYLMAEPLHHKKLDLSFQFEIDSSGKVISHGCVFFYTNTNGMYQGHYLNHGISELIGQDFSGLLAETGERLKSIIENSMYPASYEGFMGIDAMIIEENDQIKIHPCLEINCRMTMGMLSLKIQKLIHSDAKGKFEIFTGNPGEFGLFSKEMVGKYPVVMRDQRLFSGFVALTDSANSAKFGAFILLN